MTEGIRDIVETALKKREDLFLVDIKISGSKGPQKILILIDGDRGAGIEDCSAISREVASVLEEEDIVSGKYVLEVSSPGVDTPLKFLRQFKKNIGRKLKVLLSDGTEVKGQLTKVDETSISIDREVRKEKKLTTENTVIQFNAIEKAKVLISF